MAKSELRRAAGLFLRVINLPWPSPNFKGKLSSTADAVKFIAMYLFSLSAGEPTPEVCSSVANTATRQLAKETGEKVFSAFALALIGTSLLCGQVAPVQPVKRVLIIYELGLSSPAVSLLDQQIRTALENSPLQIELYREYMETTLFPDPASQREIREWYVHKYRGRKLDLIVALGRSSLRFIVDAHAGPFSGVPVVFGGTDEQLAGYPKLDSYFTGVWERFEPDKTLDTALRLQPATKHVVVVGGASEFDRHLEAIFREKLRPYQKKVDISYLTEFDMPTLVDRLKHLPENTVVLHTHFGQDVLGTPFIGAAQADPLITNAADAPVFGPSDVDMGHGEVGGELVSFTKEGRILGDITLRILSGNTPEDIPVVYGANAYMFDWHALKRWGLDEKRLPPGSIVLNREPTVWEAYKAYIIAACSLILLETALIYGLVWQIKRRRNAETELAMTYDRLRLAVDAGKSVGWEWDVKTGRDRWFGDLKNMFGIPSDTFSGTVTDFRRRVHPEDQAAVSQAIADSRKYREPYAAEFRVIRDDGLVHWVTARGKFYYNAKGEAERMLGMAVDITERKTAEESLSNLSGRLIAAQEEERHRIAREIHDDYNQRLAMLAIDLEELKENCSIDTGARLHELWNQVGELGADLHSLSHRLHSSTLERLGLVAGVRAFCQEFSEQQGIHISFVHGNLPPHIPEDGALCLFRIAQEALRNVRRHSGADKAIVRLEMTGQKLHLAVEDQGKGFELPRQGPEAGIGIRSMEERLRILGGKFEIHSRPKEGTRVDAWLPLQQAASQRAS